MRTPSSLNLLYLSIISLTAQFKAAAASFGSVTTGQNRWGIPLYTLNSTTFGSIIISFTSFGSALYKILIINVLIQTDLPEPVAPAIKRCGIFAISAIITFPAISFPTANAIADLELLNVSPSNNSRKKTGLGTGFGISIPTAAFPGIGASILMLAAARLSLKSSARFVILFTRTPCSGKSS